MKSFTRFIEEDASSDEQVRAIRNAIVALLSSGAMDALIKRDLLMKEEVHTYSAEHDEERYRQRLRTLRSGLMTLLKQDGALDDALLRQHGITKWDAQEPSTAAKTLQPQGQRARKGTPR